MERRQLADHSIMLPHVGECPEGCTAYDHNNGANACR